MKLKTRKTVLPVMVILVTKVSDIPPWLTEAAGYSLRCYETPSILIATFVYPLVNKSLS